MSARIGQTARLSRVLVGLGFTGPGESGWRERSACAGLDPELFYPVGIGAQVEAQVSRAKRVCAGCPVREACLADVMASEDPGLRWGVVGGLSAGERSALFVSRREQLSREVA